MRKDEKEIGAAVVTDLSGMDRLTIRKILSGYVQRRITRLKLESLLGPIWSSPEEFESRQRLAKVFGLNPYTARIPEIRRRAKALHLRGFSVHLLKPDLIDFISKCLLFNPTAGGQSGKKAA